MELESDDSGSTHYTAVKFKDEISKEEQLKLVHSIPITLKETESSFDGQY